MRPSALISFIIFSDCIFASLVLFPTVLLGSLIVSNCLCFSIDSA
jgi:hypothetical protein